MSKGFVIFVVKSLDYKPYFLEFGTYYNERTTRCVSDIASATVYPIYEAAKVVMDQLKDDADYYVSRFLILMETHTQPMKTQAAAQQMILHISVDQSPRMTFFDE